MSEDVRECLLLTDVTVCDAHTDVLGGTTGDERRGRDARAGIGSPRARGNMITIRADALRKAREAKQLSRSALAAASNVSERQICRIEGGEIRRVRIATASRLAAGLDISLYSLTDASFLSHLPHPGSNCEVAEEGSGECGEDLLGFLGPASFDLIGRKYGWTQERVVELAPALFLLLAELSVRWHREQLEELERSLQAGGDQGVVDRVMSLVREDDVLGELRDGRGGRLFRERFERVFAEYLRTLASEG